MSLGIYLYASHSGGIVVFIMTLCYIGLTLWSDYEEKKLYEDFGNLNDEERSEFLKDAEEELKK